MGSFNVMGNFSRQPITYGSEIVVILGIRPVIRAWGLQMNYENDFVPISLPVYGKYNDYGGIKTSSDQLSTKLICKEFELDSFDNFPYALRDDRETKLQEKINDFLDKLNLNYLDKNNGKKGHEVYFLDYVMEYKYVYDRLAALSQKPDPDWRENKYSFSDCFDLSVVYYNRLKELKLKYETEFCSEESIKDYRSWELGTREFYNLYRTRHYDSWGLFRGNEGEDTKNLLFLYDNDTLLSKDNKLELCKFAGLIKTKKFNFLPWGSSMLGGQQSMESWLEISNIFHKNCLKNITDEDYEDEFHNDYSWSVKEAIKALDEKIKKDQTQVYEDDEDLDDVDPELLNEVSKIFDEAFNDVNSESLDDSKE